MAWLTIQLRRLMGRAPPLHLVILFATIAVCSAVAAYGYINWQSYQNSNIEVLHANRPSSAADHMGWTDWYDLKAQQEMALWAYSLLWVGIVGLVTSVAGIGFIFLNLRALNEQNRIAQFTSEAQTRPYLSVSQDVTLVERQPDYLGRNFELTFAIENSGTTPAVDPQVSVALYLDSEFANPADRDNPIFVSVLDNRPTISAGQAQVVRLNVRNGGLPAANDSAPLASLTEGGGIVLVDEVADQISKDGSMWMTLQILIKYTDIASTKSYSAGTELETIEKFSFRRTFSKVKFNAERSITAFSLSELRLRHLHYGCPPTWVFGLRTDSSDNPGPPEEAPQ